MVLTVSEGLPKTSCLVDVMDLGDCILGLDSHRNSCREEQLSWEARKTLEL